jgi:acetyltransferase
MSIRNLDAIFQPQAIALVGASAHQGSIGWLIAQNLRAGGFEGPIMPVNPHARAIAGVITYPDIASLPVSPDLGVIATPPETVPGVIADLAKRGARGAIVITAGFKELGSKEGDALEQTMLDAAHPHLLRIIGPNCIGVLSTPSGLNASFAHIGAKKGAIAFVAQSGAMVTTILDWAGARGLGFSHLVSLGDMADVDFGDMLDFLANDAATKAILLYVEAVTEARKFMSAARAASRVKPVIVIKSGRHEAAAKAAASHTGALAGADDVYDAAFKRAGLLRVLDLDALFDAVETLATAPPPVGDKLAILTNGGGLGVLAADALIDHGGTLAELTQATIEKLDGKLPKTWSHGDPIDIIGDAPASRYNDALEILIGAPEVDGVLALNCPTAIASGTDAARAVAALAAKTRKPVLTSWVGSAAAEDARAIFTEARVPTYETPDQAIGGFMQLVRYRRGQNVLVEAPALSEGFTPKTDLARALVANALADKRSWLDPIEVASLFSYYDIPMAKTVLVESAEEAGRAAQGLKGVLVLKIQSHDISHKSDVGGVVMGLSGPDSVRAAAEKMQAQVARAAPQAHLEGFRLQEMIQRPNAMELILGLTVDRLFGPIMLFGRGGTAVQVIADKALGLAPLNGALARGMIGETRVFRQLKGYRNRPPADLDAIALTLVKLSQLACDLDEVIELDINPLLADDKGVIGVDARVRIEAMAPGQKRGERLVIRPYPKELAREETLAGLGTILVRPILPEDAAAMEEGFKQLTLEDVRLRFFSALKELSPRLKMRLTQIDYDREMAFVAVDKDRNILGVSRLVTDPDNIEGEFGVVVRSDLKGHGLGWLLMTKLIDYARARGTERIIGEILAQNRVMLDMSRKLGFTMGVPADGVVRATLKLR